MHIRDWTVCLLEPNKFEAQIIVDFLRNAGCEKIKVFTDSNAAMEALELYPASIVIGALESVPVDGVAWTRAFRRNMKLANRQAPIFLTSRAFSRSIAEDCRHGGANALIGKPVSNATLIATIKKVLGSPRPFIDAAGYVGPCRRAGIVTAGAPKKRRKADDSARAAAAAAAAPAPAPAPAPQIDITSMADAIVALSRSVADFVRGSGQIETCVAALRLVQAHAMSRKDDPMMRACTAMASQLQAKDTRPEVTKAALTACIAGVSQLAELAVAEAEKRDALAEEVRAVVARASVQKAA
ncbi:MAG: response regulator [Terricaulis sp.]